MGNCSLPVSGWDASNGQERTSSLLNTSRNALTQFVKHRDLCLSAKSLCLLSLGCDNWIPAHLEKQPLVLVMDRDVTEPTRPSGNLAVTLCFPVSAAALVWLGPLKDDGFFNMTH